MSWSERQARMLQAMGLRLWTPSPVAPAVETVTEAAEVPQAMAQPSRVALSPVPAQAPAPAPALAAAPRLQTVATEGLDWAGLRQTVAACRACGLCDSRSQTVFGTGHLQAHWLIVGEAPGAEEDRLGEPFVGASGQLLDTMLAALGLSRQADGEPAQRVYIVNTLKCRPPANRNPQAQELTQCLPFLQRQIELLQPRIILAMGRFAAQALLRNEAPLGQLRGQVHRAGERPVVVTYHPSYLLRSPGEKAKAWADLCLAAATLESANP